ncbi:oxidoreductase [Streptomyces davaonensis JCM 4913]|uniref:Oxidoreductase n=1 Tax=Streptomyces davaonensis (strain DSM 101723 / JCM 4913 / KCC S-0913 / 768) TaxID=1214101 RepID=K4R2K8_STRDJ|nr:Gfo/Idh/MocA family oxidoreductase [Streptomyces davaonensis]CCK26899.1 oxidoreductase [Streptomyces davaonensis JCM 4913]
MPSVGLGLLGCADIAIRKVLPALTPESGMRLVAVASRTPEKAKEAAARFNTRAVTGYQELLTDPEVEAVYIPLPPALRAPWIRAALDAGKHVFAEKPLTTNAQETAALAARASASGLTLMENYMFVHHAQHEYVRTLLSEGAIGELRTMQAAFTIPPRPPTDHRLDTALGGGALLDGAGYPIRAAQYFLGDDLTVLGASLRRSAPDAVDTAGAALLRTATGITAHITFGMEHFYVSRYQLLGTKGQITVDHAFTTPADHRPVIRMDHQNHQEQRTLTPDNQCANTLTRFATAVRTGTPTDIATSVAQSRIVEAIGNAAAR